MRKGLKKLLCIFTAATLACGAASLAACGTTFTPPQGGPSAEAEVSSNGGFVVQKGEYIYFINGVETYTADNAYGTPTKGALMRIKKADADEGKNTAETVIPSLMVAGDYTAGLFIYGDRVYYATPNNMRNTSGVVENTYLDFKSAKLDGSDIRDYFYVSDNSTQYRYVEVDGTVYLMYAGRVKKANSSSEISALLSYNTATGDRTELAASYLSFAFNSLDKTDPWIYYTMSVTDKADSDGALAYNYQQIYRVRADATEAPYEYKWDQKWLDENNSGVIPYSNLGEIVLDGRGALSAERSQFNHSDAAPLTRSEGFTYTLRSYTNGGIYFVREDGETDGYLYYLDAAKLTAGWDSVTGNGDALDVVANDTDVSAKATASALYFKENNVHHYLYIKDSEIRNVTVGAGGSTSELTVAYDVSGATLKFIDASDATYKYVYFTKSNGSGMSVERAVYNGSVDDYKNLTFEGEDNRAYTSVKLLDVQHASGWYDYEVVGGTVFYADSASIGSVSYNYVTCVDIKKADGKLMNNAELSELNEKYEEIMGTKGLVSTLSSNSNSKLSALISYYFKTGETTAYEENLQEAADHERSETYLFSEEEKAAFRAFTTPDGEDTTDLFSKDDYKDAEGNYYRTYSYFATAIGKVDADDEEAIATAWRNSIQRDIVSETEATASLAGWEIAVIVIAAVVVAAGAAGLTVYLVLKKRKAENEPAPERMKVDTTDDRSVDVYAEPAEKLAEEPVEEPAAEPAETPEEPVEEPAEEPAEPAEEPAEALAETPAETPAEAPASPEEPKE